MAHNVVARPRNQGTRLREMLDKAERLIVQLEPATVEELLQLLDRIDTLLEELETSGFDVRPEHTRWESLLNRVNSHPQPIVRAAGIVGGMAKLRAANPPAESFWWHLDAEVAQRRRKALSRAAITLTIIVVVTAGLLWGLETFFPPDPVAVALVETNSALDQLTATEDWEGALAVVQETRQRLPDQLELAVWETVLHERLGNTDAAARTLAEAEALAQVWPVELYVQLGNKRLLVNDLDGAEAAAQQGAVLDPTEPQITFLLGGIAEARGQVATAIDYFQQTFDLAQESNPQLAVIARVRMGQLMQDPSGFFESDDETETP